jgi:hypothetical protein
LDCLLQLVMFLPSHKNFKMIYDTYIQLTVSLVGSSEEYVDIGIKESILYISTRKLHETFGFFISTCVCLFHLINILDY